MHDHIIIILSGICAAVVFLLVVGVSEWIEKKLEEENKDGNP